MSRRVLTLLLSFVLAVPVALASMPQADALEITPLTQTLGQSGLTVHGDYILVGNGVLTCSGTDCQGLLSGNGTSANDDNRMVYTGAGTGWTNSSSATITVPTGAKVVSAKLMWSANTGSGETTTTYYSNTCKNGYSATVPSGSPKTTNVSIQVGTGTATSVTPTNYASDYGQLNYGWQPSYYSANADVTSAFANAATGNPINVKVGNIWAPQGNGCYGGWALQVVYDFGAYVAGNDLSVKRQIYSFDGYVRQFAGDDPATIGLTGLQIQGTGAKAGFVGYEGDRSIDGDRVQYSDPTTPAYYLPNDAAANSTVNMYVAKSDGAVPYKTTDGLSAGTSFYNGSVDAHTIQMPKLTSGDSSLTLKLDTTQDSYLMQNVTISVPMAEITIVKTAENGEADQAIKQGAVPSFRITIYNSGAVSLLNMTVVDQATPSCDKSASELLAIVTKQYPTGQIPPGGSVQYTCQGTATNTSFTNVASVSGQTPNGLVVNSSGGAEVQVANWDVKKTAKYPDVPTGTNATWVITIRNTGGADIYGVTITDPVTPSCARTVDLIQAGETLTYECQGVVNTTTTNTVNATGTAKASRTATQSVPMTGTSAATVQVAAVQLTKTADKQLYNVGEKATFTFTVKNTGTAVLNQFTINDPAFPTCNRTVTTPLAAGATTTVTCQVTPYPTASSNTVTNAATVTAWPPSGQTVTSASSVDVNNKSIKLAKSSTTTDVNGNGILDAGDRVVYSFQVTNTGSSTLTNGAINDPMLAGLAITCGTTTLAPGASTTCTAAPYTVKQSDVDAGTLKNTATATGTGIDGSTTTATASTTLTPVQNPAISLTKTANPTSANAKGGLITYTFVATNSGNVTLTGVSIADPLAGLSALTCKDGTGATVTQPATLAPGAKLTCTATITATQEHVDAGSLANTASVSGTSPKGTVVNATANAVVTFDQKSSVVIKKTANVSTFTSVGQVVTYTFTATNTGTTTLSGVTMADPSPRLANRTCAKPQPTSLAPGESNTCTATLTITQADLDAGSIVNTATVNANSPQGTLTGQSTWVIDPSVNAALTLEKTASRSTVTAAGQVITYSFTVTNAGTSTLNNVTVADPKTGMSALSCTPAMGTSLAPGGKMTCTATYTTTQADIDSPAITNTATANATDSHGTKVTQTASRTVTPVQTNALTLTKAASPSTVTKAGQQVTYTMTVRNGGNTTLTNVRVADPMSGLSAITCNPAQGSSLAPNATMTCTATYTATQANMNAGSFKNTATVTGTSPTGGAVTSTANATVVATSQPGMTTAKSSNVTEVTGAGQVITYTIAATNTGNVSLTMTAISDPKVSGLTCAPVAAGQVLDPGVTTTCTGTHTVTLAEMNSGSIINTATVTATPPTGTAITQNPTTVVTALNDPAISLTKAVDKTTYAAVGDALTYTLTATNTGNVTLSGVAINDPLFPPSSLNCTPALNSSLAPNATMACTVTLRITQAHLDAGAVNNTATATGKSPSGTTVSAQASASSTAVQTRTSTFTKTSDVASVDAVGKNITYTMTFTNTGNVSWANVRISDPRVPTFSSCTPALGSTVLPGGTMVCTGNYATTLADMNAGSIINTATFTGTAAGGTPTSGTSTNTVEALPAPQLTLSKTATPTRVSKVGDVITYTFQVSNTGNVTATTIAITDPMRGLSAVTCQATTLNPGQNTTCTATKTVDQQDLDTASGTLDNTATVNATQTNGTAFPAASATAKVTLGQSPAQTITKTASVASVSAVGDPVTYTITVTNSGNVTLTNVQVTDSLIETAALSCTPALGSSLAVGATLVCTGSRPATQGDLDNGVILNTAQTNAVGPTGATLPWSSATARVTATQTPKVSLDKTANLTAVDTVGQTVTYSYVVTNTGNVTLNSLTVVDAHPGLGNIVCPAGSSTLAPGATITCTANYTVTQADLNAGSILDTATVRLEAPGGSSSSTTDDVTATDSHTITATQNPSLAFSKSVNQLTVRSVGRVLTYTFTATNTGNVDVTNVRVADPLPGLSALSCTPAAGTTLTPGKSMTCTATYTVTLADLNAGSIVNTASVTGTAPDGSTLTRTDSKTVTALMEPSISLTKAADPTTVTAVGQKVAYTFTVKNTGNVSVSAVGVADPMAGLGAITCAATALDPGASTTCTASYTVTQADLDRGSIPNTATASATAPNGSSTSATASATVGVTQTPSLSLDKSASIATFNATGTAVTYSFLVTNTGNTTVNGIAVTDRLPGLTNLTCPTTTLAPGATTTCTATYSTRQSDLDAGKIVNSATVDGTTTTGIPVKPGSDTVTITAEQNPSSTFAKVADKTTVATVGETVTYTFTFTNTGNVTLGGVLIKDPLPGLSTLTCTIRAVDGTTRQGSGSVALAPGEVKTCTATYSVKQTDLNAGTIVNTASAASTNPDGSARPAQTSTATVTATQSPSMTFTKSVDSPTYSRVGQVVNYTFTLVNTGNVTLTNPSITDPMPGLSALTCSPAGATTLEPRGTLRCTASYTIKQSDLNAMSVVNNATATATPPTGAALTQTGTTTSTATLSPALSMTKTSSPNPATKAGETITYSFVVTNTGNVMVSSIAIADPLPGLSAITCPVTALDAGQSTTCTATMTLTQAQADKGSVSNTATVTGTDPAGTSVSKTSSNVLRITQTPTLTLSKKANVASVTKVGDPVTYTFVVTNTGNVTINQLKLTDVRLGSAPVACPVDTLAPGASTTCTADYAATQADIDAGSFTNTASVTGTTTSGTAVPPVTASSTVDAPANPSWTFVKSADHYNVTKIGEAVTYTLVVTNTGNVTLHNVFMSDPKVSDPTTSRLFDCYVLNADGSRAVDAPGAIDLLPGQQKVCHGTRTFVQADFETPDPNKATPGIDWNNQAYVNALKPDGTAMPQLLSTAPADAPIPQGANGETVVALYPSPDFVMDKRASAQEYSRVGQVINYTVTATNSGNVDMNNVQVVDLKLTSTTYSCTPALGSTLKPGQMMVCTGSYTVTQADINAGSIVNEATASAVDNQGTTFNASKAAVLEVVANVPDGITLEKTASPSQVTRAGQVVTYSFLLTNIGMTEITGLAFTDTMLSDQGIAISCPSTSLAGTPDTDNDGLPNLENPSQMTCTAQYTATQADIDKKGFLNTATVTGTTYNQGTNKTVSSTSSAQVTAIHQPKLTMTKTPDKTSVSAVGEQVVYTFAVTNDGNVAISGIALTDPMANLSPISCPETSLAPGATMNCTATLTVGQAQLDLKAIPNTATVTGRDLDNNPVTTTATASITTVQDPSWTFTKTASPTTIDTVGQQITYTATVVNTGNITLYNTTVTDPMASRLAGWSCTPTAAVIAPGQSRTCTGTVMVTQADLDAGSLVNTASINPLNGSGVVVGTSPRTATATVDVAQTAAIAVDKTVDASTYGAVGDVLHYDFTVTNQGNTSITGVAVDDSLTGSGLQDLTCSPAIGSTLAGGQVMTCTAAYTITQADLDAGSVINAVTVSGTAPTGPVSASDTVTSTAQLTPRVDLFKSASTSIYDHAGQEITYTFTVTNTGNTTLTSIGVADAFTTTNNTAPLAVTCPSGSLAPKAVATCTATYTVTQADINVANPGEGLGLSNAATVTAASSDGTTVTATDTLTLQVDHRPSMTMEKTAAETTYAAPGDVVHYSMVVTNTGNVALQGTVTDPLLPGVDCGTVTSIDPGQQVTCTGSYTVTQDDIDHGFLSNTATATGNDPDGDINVTVQDTLVINATQTPRITLTKSGNPTTVTQIGDLITYEVIATNAGNVTLNNVFVSDPLPGLSSFDCGTQTGPVSLAPGESKTCHATYHATAADFNAGSLINTAKVDAQSPQGPLTENAVATTAMTQSPALTTTKTVDNATYTSVGQKLTYTIVVRNTGNVDVRNIGLQESIATETPTCTPALGSTLAVDSSLTCTVVHTVTQADLDAMSVVNVATATGTGPGEVAVSAPSNAATSTASLNPSVYLEKSVAPNVVTKANTPVTYTFDVTNTGNVRLINLTLADPMPNLGAITCQLDGAAVASPYTLDAGQHMTCTAPYTVTQADIDAGAAGLTNSATISGTDPALTPVSASDTTSITIEHQPQLALTKTASSNPIAAVGDVTTYTFEITNPGNVTMHGISLTDPIARLSAFTCTQNGAAVDLATATIAPTAVAPEQKIVCTATRAAIQATLDAVSVTNTATVTGLDPEGETSQPVSASAVIHPVQSPAIDLVKTADKTTVTTVGEPVVYTVTLTNTGTVTVKNANFTDPNLNLRRFTLLGCTIQHTDGTTSLGEGAVTLAPGESKVCHVETYVNQADLDAGSMVNNAKASATAPDGSGLTDADAWTIQAVTTPAVELVKTVSPYRVQQAGDTVTYEFTISNPGTTSLTQIALSDPIPGLSGFTCDQDLATAVLAPGGEIHCSATMVVSSDQMAMATVPNTATVKAVPKQGAAVSAESMAVFVPVHQPKLDLVKSHTSGDVTKAGDLVTYTFTVTNSGNITVAQVGIDDPLIANQADPALRTITCTPTTLEVGQQASCTGTYKATQADVDRGRISNTATTTGVDPIGGDPVTQGTASHEVTALSTPSLTVKKTAVTAGPLNVGDHAEFTIDVTNDGNVTLSDVRLDESRPLIEPPSCTPAEGSSLAPGQVMHCTVITATDQVDVDLGSTDNLAWAAAFDPNNNPVYSNQSWDSIPTVVGEADRTFTKTSDHDGRPITRAGEVITYTFTWKNTGTLSLFAEGEINDQLEGLSAITCDMPLDEAVFPGETVTCQAKYTVTQADVDRGTLVNTATLTDAPAYQGEPVTSTATNTLDVAQTPSLTLTKSVDRATVNNAGDVLTYTIAVRNTGNVTVSSIDVTDQKLDNLSPLTCTTADGTTPVTMPATLAPGEGLLCTTTYRVTQNDIDAGSILNAAVAEGTSPSGSTVTSNVGEAVVEANQNPLLEMTKKADKALVQRVGETVTYTITAKNTGNVTLKGATINDPMPLANWTCTPAAGSDLAPGVTMTCSGVYTVTHTDLERSGISNVADFSATAPDGSSVIGDAATTVPALYNPKLSFTKSVSAPTNWVAGDTITYTFVTTNVGNMPAHYVTGVDTMADLSTLVCVDPTGAVVTQGDEDPLPPGASVTCTATYKAKQSDVDRGFVNNTATLTAKEATGEPFPTEVASAKTTTTHQGSFTLAKSPSVTQATKAGQQLTYSFVLTNTGELTLSAPTVVDGMPGLSAITCVDDQVAPHASITCTAAYTVTQKDMDAGRFTNTATATLRQPDGTTVTTAPATAEVTTAQLPSLGIVKSAATSQVTKAGEVVDFTITVTNTGNVTATDVRVADPNPGAVIESCDRSAPVSLAPAETLTCQVRYTVSQAEMDAGRVRNVATADAMTPLGSRFPQATTTADVTAQQTPDVTFAKQANTASYDSTSNVITYTMTLTNTGNVSLKKVTITDPAPGLTAMTCTVNGASVSLATLILGPGQAVICTTQHTITQADLDAGSLRNTASYAVTPPVGTALTGSSTVLLDSVMKGALSLVKTADKTSVAALSDVITYTFTVTNTGNVTLHNVLVSDPRTGAGMGTISCPKTALVPGEKMVCSAPFSPAQMDLDKGTIPNTATVTGADPENNPAERGEGSTTVDVEQRPDYEITKSADHTLLQRAGEQVVYTIVGKNTGNVTLQVVTMTDPMFPTLFTGDSGGVAPKDQLDCYPRLPAMLPPGDTVVCRGMHQFTQTEIDKGQVDNTATINGQDPQGTALPPKQATETVRTVVDAKLGITKNTDTVAIDTIGQPVTYEFVLTNQSNVSVSNVRFRDPMFAPLGADGTPDLTVPPVGIECYDGTAWLPYVDGETFAPESGRTCRGTHVVTVADMDRGHLPNTATIAATEPNGKEIYTPSDTWTDPNTPQLYAASVDLPATQKPALRVTDTPSVPSYAKPGETIRFTYQVTNTGNVTATDVTLTSTLPGNPRIICPVPMGALRAMAGGMPTTVGTLIPGATVECYVDYTVTQEDIDRGSLGDTVTAGGNYAAYDPSAPGQVVTKPIAQVHADATVDAAQRALMTILKTADQTSVKAVGDPVTYTFAMRNEGNVTMTHVAFSDPLAGLQASTCQLTYPLSADPVAEDVTLPVASVAPGGLVTCTATRLTSQADLDSGSTLNTAVVTGTDPAGKVFLGDPSKAVVESVQDSQVDIAKTGTVADTDGNGKASTGETITYDITVTNTGTVTLTTVKVSDKMLTRLTCDQTLPATLAPGNTLSCRGTHVVTQAEADAGTLQNIAGVTSTQTGAVTKVAEVDMMTGDPVKPAPTPEPTPTPTPTPTLPAPPSVAPAKPAPTPTTPPRLADTGSGVPVNALMWWLALVLVGMMVVLRTETKEKS